MPTALKASRRWKVSFVGGKMAAKPFGNPLPAASALHQFNRPSIPKDARAILAAVVEKNAVPVLQENVCVAAGDSRRNFVGIIFERDVIAADHAVRGVRDLRHSTDVDALLV